MAMSSCLHRTEDEPIDKNKESDEEEQKKKQEKQKGKKKQTEASDADVNEDTPMQLPGMEILLLLLILLINFIEIPALGSSRSVGGIAHSQSHGNAPNVGDFEEPSNNEGPEIGQVFVYHLLDRPLPGLLSGTPISFMLDDIVIGATVSQILQTLIETGNIHVQGKF